jgi:hypothetical protein
MDGCVVYTDYGLQRGDCRRDDEQTVRRFLQETVVSIDEIKGSEHDFIQ